MKTNPTPTQQGETLEQGDCGLRAFNAGLRYCGLPDYKGVLRMSDDVIALAQSYGLDVYDKGRAYQGQNEPILVIYRDGKTSTNAEYHAVFASDVAPWQSVYVLVAGWDELRANTRRAAVAGPRERNQQDESEVVTIIEQFGDLDNKSLLREHLLALLTRVRLAAATSSPTPAESMKTFDYMCDAQPNCGWRSTNKSRPLGRGIKVGCPDCKGDARFIGITSAPPESTRAEGEQER